MPTAILPSPILTFLVRRPLLDNPCSWYGPFRHYYAYQTGHACTAKAAIAPYQYRTSTVPVKYQYRTSTVPLPYWLFVSMVRFAFFLRFFCYLRLFFFFFFFFLLS